MKTILCFECVISIFEFELLVIKCVCANSGLTPVIRQKQRTIAKLLIDC